MRKLPGYRKFLAVFKKLGKKWGKLKNKAQTFMHKCRNTPLSDVTGLIA